MKTSLYVCVLVKTIPWNMAFLILRVAVKFLIFPSYCEVYNVLKSRSLLSYSIVSECLWTKFSHISRAHFSKRNKCFNVKTLTYYFHVKTTILVDFLICISVLSTIKTLRHCSIVFILNLEQFHTLFLCFSS